MKIVYVDTDISGHHISYISALVNGLDNDVVAILPEEVNDLSCKQYTYTTSDWKNGKRSFSQYRKWLDEIYSIIEIEKPDIVHFLYGDFFYRFFGLGLKKFKKYKTVVIIHGLRYGFLNVTSAKMISSFVDKVVVHSEYLKNRFINYGRKNGVHIEYPNFNEKECKPDEARECYNLKPGIPVLGCIGETRTEKGLDILLEALKAVKKPFQLLVAGKPIDYDEEFIKEATKSYKENVHIKLCFLSDDELNKALHSSDIIVLPYRKSFNAASGPLIEGVSINKCIVAPSHGNLYDVVTKNHLGYTFESENVSSLTEVIERVLDNDFIPDENYKKHQEKLKVSYFLKSYDELYKNLL